MKLFLFIIPLAFAADYLVSSAAGATEVQCTYPLCSLCNSTSAYLVNDINNFQIPNYLASTSSLLQDMIAELSLYISATTFTVSVSDEGMCVFASDIKESNDLEGLTINFLEVEYEEIVLIEIFESDLTLSEVVTRAERGSGNGYAWTDLDIKHKASDSAVISSSVNLELEELWQVLQRDKQEVKYAGITYLGVNMEIKNDFSIKTSYVRVEYQDFNVTIINDVTLLGNLADYLDDSAKCSEVKSPRGLEYVQSLLPIYANMVFVTNSSETFIQDYTTIYAESPDFSLAQGIYLKNPIVNLKISHISLKCQLDVIGDWNIENVPELQIDVITDKDEEHAEVTISDSVDEISFSEIEIIFKQLSTGIASIFPQYQSGASILDRLYEVNCLEILIDLLFEPETYATLTCDGKIQDEKDASIDGYFGSFNTTIESVFEFSNIKLDSLGFLLGNEFPSFITVKNPYLTSSTGNVNLGASVFEIDNKYKYGINVAYDITTWSNCTENPCDNFVIVNLTDPINMRGEYYPGEFYAEGGLDVVELAKEVYLYNTLFVEYFEPKRPIYLQGKLDVVADSVSTQTFKANMTLGDDFIMTARMSAEWKTVFELQTLTISSLVLNYKIEEQEVVTENNPGIATFSCGEEKDC